MIEKDDQTKDNDGSNMNGCQMMDNKKNVGCVVSSDD